MDNLLCDESWLSDPLTPEPEPNFCLNIHDDHVVMSPGIDAARVEEAISIDLEKESCFSNHGHKFVEFLASKKLIDARFRTVQWLIQTRSRLNLSFETLFSAANCFDRFVNVISCDEWSKWMVELVAVTSLSVASKFNDVASPSPQELQMEGLTHMFHHKTVLEMELILLKALDWRVNSVTSLSFSQILMTKMGIAGGDIMMNRITEHLLDDLCDLKMLGYAPSVVAVAAMWTVLEEKAALEDNFGKIMNLFGQEHKEKIAKCIHVMKSRNVEKGWGRKVSEVKSLVSVLQRGDIMNMNDVYYGGDLSTIFQILRSEGINKKRDRDFYEDKLRPAKRMTFVMSD
ncbi:putative cyclin-D7-1 [Brassica napus]|uniref:putative cyclin-D7-1 n=1 Tax=Brassica napus TaxID=3708 RepID=UPI0020787EB7|nr:putative cyclin-D7-1 [Brassica napus]